MKTKAATGGGTEELVNDEKVDGAVGEDPEDIFVVIESPGTADVDNAGFVAILGGAMGDCKADVGEPSDVDVRSWAKDDDGSMEDKRSSAGERDDEDLQRQHLILPRIWLCIFRSSAGARTSLESHTQLVCLPDNPDHEQS
ncbi:MAG: hypothetical protein M1827_003736 [Pycnora praestabilis]|nr:MAG: hypothetical protein M1827_003736 [Pycnora praestabilis]